MFKWLNFKKTRISDEERKIILQKCIDRLLNSCLDGAIQNEIDYAKKSESTSIQGYIGFYYWPGDETGLLPYYYCNSCKNTNALIKENQNEFLKDLFGRECNSYLCKNDIIAIDKCKKMYPNGDECSFDLSNHRLYETLFCLSIDEMNYVISSIKSYLSSKEYDNFTAQTEKINNSSFRHENKTNDESITAIKIELNF